MSAIQNLAGAVYRLANDSLQVTRPGGGAYDGTGTYQPNAASQFPIPRAVVRRPAEKGDLKHLAEGDRKGRTASFDVVMVAPFTAANPPLQFRDTVTLQDGEVYEVRHVEPLGTTAAVLHAVGVRAPQLNP